MKLSIEITDDEIRDAVFDLIVRRAADEIANNLYVNKYGYRDKKVYDTAIKEAVRGMMKPHIDDIVERAVNAAAYQIEHKGLKKLLDEKLK